MSSGRSFPGRAMWAGVLLVAASCRPAVEANVPCGTLGDAACPTGWQCGLERRCVPGERVAVVTHALPASGSGAIDLRWELDARADVTAAELVLRGADGTTLAPATQAFEWSEPNRKGGYVTRFETWKLADGDATFELALTAGDVRSDYRFPWRIAQQPTSLALAAPSLGLVARSQVEVLVDVTGSVPWVSLEAKVGASSRAASPEQLGLARVQLSVPLTAEPDGPATLKVKVVDALGAVKEVERSIVVSNVPARIVEVVGPTLLSPKRQAAGDRVRVRTEGLLDGTPTLVSMTQGALSFGEAVAGETPGDWFFERVSGTWSGSVSVLATVKDVMGPVSDLGGTVQVDFAPPTVTSGSPPRERRLSGNVIELVITCSEDGASVRFATDTTARVEGTCGTAEQVISGSGTRLTSLELEDAEGNVASLADWTTVLRGTPRAAITRLVESGSNLLELVSRRQAFVASPALAASGGAVLRLDPAQLPPSADDWLAMPQPLLKGTHLRPVVWTSGAAPVLVWLQDGELATAVNLNSQGTGDVMLPWVRLPSRGRPAIVGGHEVAWVTPTAVVRRSIRSLGATAAPVANAAQESLSCGGVLFGARIDSGRATAYWAGASGVVRSQVLAGATSSLPPEVEVRSTCADGWPVVLLLSDVLLEPYALTEPEGSWSQAPFASVTPRPPARAGACMGPDGHFGGGVDALGQPVRDLWRIGRGTITSVVAANQGPRRRDATLVGVGEDVLVLGGRSATGITTLVSRASQGFTESTQTTQDGARTLLAAATGLTVETLTVEQLPNAAPRLVLDTGFAKTSTTLPSSTWASVAVQPGSQRISVVAGSGNSAMLYDCGTAAASCVAVSEPFSIGPSSLVANANAPLVLFPRSGGTPFALYADGTLASTNFTTPLPGASDVAFTPDAGVARVAVSTPVGGVPGVRILTCDLPSTLGQTKGCTAGTARAAAWPAIPMPFTGLEQKVLHGGGLLDLSDGSLVDVAVPLATSAHGTGALRDQALTDSVKLPNDAFDPPWTSLSNRSRVAYLLEVPAGLRASGRVRARLPNPADGFLFVRVEALGVEAQAFPSGGDDWKTFDWSVQGRTESARVVIIAQGSTQPVLEVDEATYEVEIER